MNFEEALNRYAKLVVEVGANVQKDQYVVIRTPIEGIDFARALVKCAYEVGAKRVFVEYSDEEITKMLYHYASEETLSTYPTWDADKYNELARQNAVFISISAEDPDLLKDIPVSKISAARKSSAKALSSYRQMTSNSEVCWCVVSIPTSKWGQKVFSDVSPEEAKALLWDKIFEVTRIYEEDPVAAWQEHTAQLANRCTYLNEKQIVSLHYTAPGTDLTVKLPEGHIWEGGGEYSAKGIYFVANMPTEEVFTMPHKYGVDGTLKATKPLSYGGHLIEDFDFTFKEGKIVGYNARVGLEALRELIETDEGSHYLGEVAIVPHSSPVSQANTIFYNTLFDENASCHFAIGRCYPTNIKEGTSLNEQELEKLGGNSSITHVDFMVGSKELTITAMTVLGEEFIVLKDGEWYF